MLSAAGAGESWGIAIDEHVDPLWVTDKPPPL
jgi:hypothetical protein